MTDVADIFKLAVRTDYESLDKCRNMVKALCSEYTANTLYV